MKRFLQLLLIMLSALLLFFSGCDRRVKTNYSYGSVFVMTGGIFIA